MPFSSLVPDRRGSRHIPAADEGATLEARPGWLRQRAAGRHPPVGGVAHGVGLGPRRHFDPRDEFVLQGIVWRQATRRVPSETAGQEVQERVVVTLENLS